MLERSKQGAVDVVRLDEALCATNVEEVAAAVDACISNGQPRLVFDLADVPLLDSAGLELLLDIRDRCADRGGLLQLATPNALCRDILRATGVADQFELFDNIVSAAGSFAQ